MKIAKNIYHTRQIVDEVCEINVHNNVYLAGKNEKNKHKHKNLKLLQVLLQVARLLGSEPIDTLFNTGGLLPISV